MSLIIKICGMRDRQNIIEVAGLNPDIMGFIFYPHSPRYAAGILDADIIGNIPAQIRKTGVFVNADYKDISAAVKKYSLDMVQLHGNERPDLCRRLRETGIQVIKAFNIKNSTRFNSFSEFKTDTDYLLFDASTSDYGGSGSKFDWNSLDRYDLGHPFFLSGGISPDDVNNILKISNPSFYGIDLNSKFETNPGLKEIETLKKFISDIRLK
jgi:phosphoribosylanthranilate isomerase